MSQSGGGSAEGIRQYLKEIARFSRLTVAEEQEVGRRALAGDEAAIRRLVEANLRFVVHWAKRYRGMGLSFADLINEGNLGLLEAAKRFDPSKGVKFVTYAVWWIRQAMLHALNEQRGNLRLPQRQANLLLKLGRVQERLSQAGHHEPTYRELAEEMGLTPEAVEDLLLHRGEDVSLDVLSDAEHDFHLADKLEQKLIPSPEETYMQGALQQHVQEMLHTLSPKEQEVLVRRFGLDGQEPGTLKEVGDAVGLSRERVRQIEMNALRRIRRSQRFRHLRGYLN